MSDLSVHQKEITLEQSDVDGALLQLRGFVITNETELQWAAELLLRAKERSRILEDKRKEITRPILTAKGAVDGMFKPLVSRYEKAEEILKGKIADWTSLVESQRRATMAASAAEYQAGGTPTAIIPEPAKVEGISVRKVWDFEFTEDDTRSVPREYCSPDVKKITQAIRMGVREIPGVRIFEKDQVSARVK